MNISKAIPVRFWLNGQETFNQKDVPGVEKAFFGQKFQLSDSIVLQLSDTVEKTYIIVIVDSTDAEVEEIIATREEVEGIHYYSWSFSFADLELAAGCYTLKIYTSQIEGSGAITAPIGIISGTGTVGIYVEIVGDGDVTAPIATVSGAGLNYPFESALFRLAATTDDICAAATMTLYYSGVFGTGTVMYINKEFSTWPVGYNYIVNEDGFSEIYQYDDSNGEVGADTGLNCEA